MTPESARLMAHYNQWMNERVYAAALVLPAEAVTQARGAFFGSIFGTLNHLACGDCLWLHRFASVPTADGLRAALASWPQPTSLTHSMAPDLPTLWELRRAIDVVILTWAQALTSSELAGALSYRNMAGLVQRKPLAELVLHFFNHQTHHRGQVTTLLTQAGADVGVTDLLAVIKNID